MSIYASIPGIGDPGDDEALGKPWIYQGSHILPDEDDPRGGSISLAIIPSHITRDGRDNQPEDGRPWPWLRLSVDTDTDDPAVLLNPTQARHHGAQLTAWADEAAPHPTPDSLRDRYVALFRHAPGELRLGDEPPGPIADAVLAVRDEEVDRLRGELTRLQEAGDHHLDAAEKERDQLRADAEAWRRKAIRRGLDGGRARHAIEGVRYLAGEDITARTDWGDGYRAAMHDLREVLTAYGQLAEPTLITEA